MTALPSIDVAIVTWNSGRFIRCCLDALAAQEMTPRQVVIVDNGSTDQSVEIARAHPVVTRVDCAGENLGFAAAQNRAIAQTQADWILVLNPDTRLEKGFLSELAQRTDQTPRLGSVCGKLLRLGQDLEPVSPPRIDSAGVEMFRSFRHLDRGSGEIEDGQYAVEERVFGASGAAALYNRSMVADVAVDGEFFDSAFFAFREDADLAWRAQILGWDCLYVPTAVGYHVRQVLPERRAEVPSVLNRYSVRNRFLMRWKNADIGTWRHCSWRGIGRDLAVIIGCFAWEWSSIPGLADAIRMAPRAFRQHAWIEANRRRTSEEVLAWFR